MQHEMHVVPHPTEAVYRCEAVKRWGLIFDFLLTSQRLLHETRFPRRDHWQHSRVLYDCMWTVWLPQANHSD